MAIKTEAEALEALSTAYDDMVTEPVADEEAVVDEVQAEPEPDEPKEQAEPVTEPATDPETPEVVPAPVGFTDEERKQFATLQPDAQRAIARMESERAAAFTRNQQELAEQRKGYEALEETIRDHRERWRLNGVSDAQAIGRLLAAEAYLTRDPIGGLRYLANLYRVDPTKLTQQRSQNPLDPVMQELNGLKAQLQQRDEQGRASQQQQLVSQIERWGAELGGDGQPLRPYFEQVSAQMMDLIPGLRRQDPAADNMTLLAKAYDMATYAHPDVRKTILDAEIRKTQAARDAEAKKRTLAAKRAASSPASDSAGGAEPKPASADDATRAAWEALAT